MTTAEFNAARGLLGQTDDQLAAELGVPPGVVRAWAAGNTRIPRRFAQQIRWNAAAAERQTALRESGLPECEWMRAQNELPLPSDTKALLHRAKTMTAHAQTCPVCMARERYVRERVGPMPAPPRSGWLRVFGWFERVPAWARPAAAGALLLGAVVSVRVVFALPFLFSSPDKLGAALLAVLAAAGAGAAGGAAYSLARPTLRKLGRPGDYLTGIVCVFAYMGSLALVAPYVFGQPLVNERSDWVIFLVVSMFFGLAVGHSWFRQTTTS